MYSPKPKIDCSTTAVPINRYLVKTKTVKYTLSEKVESVRTRYFVQWKNIFSDAVNVFIRPLRTYPVIASSLASLFFWLKGQEQMAQFVFFAGALTLDSATEANNSSSFSVTVASNSNRILYMGFGHYQGGNNISSCSYNSDALTEVKAQAGSYGERAGLWGLVAPDTGTNTFSISGNDSWTGYGVVSIYDADQNLSANTAGASGDSGWANVSVTTTVDNAWVLAAFGSEAVPTMDSSLGGSPVEDMIEQGYSYQNAEMHHNLKATAGSQTIGCDLSYGSRWNVAACEVKPYAGGGGSPTNHFLSLLGVGT